MARSRPPGPPADFTAPPGGQPVPREIAKQELARRLVKFMQDRDWTQSDLARAADMPRELISSYVRRKSWPEPRQQRRLADALGVKVSDLAPAATGMNYDEEMPSFSMTEVTGHRGVAWLRINRMVSTETAVKIGSLLAQDLTEAK